MNHFQYMKRALGQYPPVPCAPWHMTFGDRCLNCGYDGNRQNSDLCPGDEVEYHNYSHGKIERGYVVALVSGSPRAVYHEDGKFDANYLKMVVGIAPRLPFAREGASWHKLTSIIKVIPIDSSPVV